MNSIAQSPAITPDISVTRFISSTARCEDNNLIGLLVFGIQNTSEKLFRCDAIQAALIGSGNVSALTELADIDMTLIDTAPLKYLSAYISLVNLQSVLPENSYLIKIQNNCEQVIQQQNTEQHAAAFSTYLTAKDIAATANRDINEAIQVAKHSDKPALSDPLTQLKFYKDQITGQEQKPVINRAKPFIKIPVEIKQGEIDFNSLTGLYAQDSER
ncbi:MAG TPA: hypothetical protein DIT05_05260 [Morganella sp. (in: Bacteria)]|nr:hypothetical protein [Morganella sp. (in: enterobacteria)]